MAKNDKTLFYVGGAVAVYVLIVNPILKKLGIRQSQTITETQSSVNTPFSPNFWKSIPGAPLLTRQTTELLAARIYNAFGLLQDDFNAIISVFRSLKYQTQVSWLADIFQQKYNADLFTFLQNGGGILPWDGLSDSQLQQIIILVQKLPKR